MSQNQANSGGTSSLPADADPATASTSEQTGLDSTGLDSTGLDSTGLDSTELGPTGRPLPMFDEPALPNPDTPATVIAMCNQKGGVGKTTTVINHGAARAEPGMGLFIDAFDPEGSQSVGMGDNVHVLDTSIYPVMMDREMPIDKIIMPSSTPGMNLIPANIELSAAEVRLVTAVGREQALARVLHPLKSDYDVILIDCQPSLGLLTVNALTVAHGVIIPLECEYFALRGVALLKDTIEKVRERTNFDLRIIGLLGTM